MRIDSDSAADGIRSLGKGSLLEKVDVRVTSAFGTYRCIRKMGMTWDRAIFMDMTLPFGLHSAPKIFTAVADAVEWICEAGKIHICNPLPKRLPDHWSPRHCSTALQKLLDLFHKLGLRVALEKRGGRATRLEFLQWQWQ